MDSRTAQNERALSGRRTLLDVSRPRQLALVILMVVASCFLILGGITPASAATVTPSSAATVTATVPLHFAPYNCRDSLYDIGPDYVTASGYDWMKQEWVYWTASLQRWSGSTWVTVSGSSFPWTRFPSTYWTGGTWVAGGLILSNVPHWEPPGGYYYRVIHRFYWPSHGAYGPWEAGPSCFLSGFVIES